MPRASVDLYKLHTSCKRLCLYEWQIIVPVRMNKEYVVNSRCGLMGMSSTNVTKATICSSWPVLFFL